MLLTAPPPAGASAGQVKLTPAQRAEENRRRAYKARVARAAKRYGLTVEEWVETYPGRAAFGAWNTAPVVVASEVGGLGARSGAAVGLQRRVDGAKLPA